MAGLQSRPLFEMTAYLTPFEDIGLTPLGRRQITHVTHGQFEGERLRGEITPGGGEWALSRFDRVGRLDVRLLLRTDDDAPIYMSYTGLMHGSREMMRRAFTHGDVDPEQYYFRTTPYFETGDGRYAWLNRLVAVGVGRTLPNAGVSYAVHEIL